MAGHDIIVIGASAGGVEALLEMARQLPAGLLAALFIVVHRPAEGPSLLPELLSNAGALPAIEARESMPIERGCIYIAPADRHLLIERDHLHTARGPKENGFRPAVDALFRTAARTYGERVVGVVLTGMLDDGTAGLLDIKRHGGIAVVQDPADALYPSMPQSALRYVAVDAVLPLADIAPALVRLAAMPTLHNEFPESTEIVTMNQQAQEQTGEPGVPVPLSCPDCEGVLAEFYDGELLRFRCQTGHIFSRESLLTTQTDMLDRSLWAAYNSLGERVYLARRLIEDARMLGDTHGFQRFTRMLTDAEARREQIRTALLKEEG